MIFLSFVGIPEHENGTKLYNFPVDTPCAETARRINKALSVLRFFQCPVTLHPRRRKSHNTAFRILNHWKWRRNNMALQLKHFMLEFLLVLELVALSKCFTPKCVFSNCSKINLNQHNYSHESIYFFRWFSNEKRQLFSPYLSQAIIPM